MCHFKNSGGAATGHRLRASAVPIRGRGVRHRCRSDNLLRRQWTSNKPGQRCAYNHAQAAHHAVELRCPQQHILVESVHSLATQIAEEAATQQFTDPAASGSSSGWNCSAVQHSAQSPLDPEPIASEFTLTGQAEDHSSHFGLGAATAAVAAQSAGVSSTQTTQATISGESAQSPPSLSALAAAPVSVGQRQWQWLGRQ